MHLPQSSTNKESNLNPYTIQFLHDSQIGLLLCDIRIDTIDQSQTIFVVLTYEAAQKV